jgi:hypothetical protein
LTRRWLFVVVGFIIFFFLCISSYFETQGGKK